MTEAQIGSSRVKAGDFLFFDDAILERFDRLYVLRNVRIFETSIGWTRMGGKLHTGEVFENKNLVVSDGDLALDLGQLEQGREANMISKGDFLLVFRVGVENSWFGYVLVLQHFFIQRERKVACDAFCIAKECDVEFFERYGHTTACQSNFRRGRWKFESKGH